MPTKFVRQKERELWKVKTEVEALRAIAPLLSDDNGVTDDHKTAAAGSNVPSRLVRMQQAVNASHQPADAPSGKTAARGGRSSLTLLSATSQPGYETARRLRRWAIVDRPAVAQDVSLKNAHT